jgi:hypothetical protein
MAYPNSPATSRIPKHDKEAIVCTILNSAVTLLDGLALHALFRSRNCSASLQGATVPSPRLAHMGTARANSGRLSFSRKVDWV